MLRSILSNPSLSPYSSSLATLLVMGVVCLVRARFSRSIHSHFKHSCWQKLIVKERGCRRQTRYMSDIPKAPGLLCCCRMLNRDLNSDLTPVSSKTSRTAVSAISSPGSDRPPGNFHMFFNLFRSCTTSTFLVLTSNTAPATPTWCVAYPGSLLGPSPSHRVSVEEWGFAWWKQKPREAAGAMKWLCRMGMCSQAAIRPSERHC